MFGVDGGKRSVCHINYSGKYAFPEASPYYRPLYSWNSSGNSFLNTFGGPDSHIGIGGAHVLTNSSR